MNASVLFPAHPRPVLGLLLMLSTVLSLTAQPGAVDPAFYRAAVFDDTVFAVALQPNGQVLAGGTFTKVGGLRRNGIARLNRKIGRAHV